MQLMRRGQRVPKRPGLLLGYCWCMRPHASFDWFVVRCTPEPACDLAALSLTLLAVPTTTSTTGDRTDSIRQELCPSQPPEVLSGPLHREYLRPAGVSASSHITGQACCCWLGGSTISVRRISDVLALSKILSTRICTGDYFALSEAFSFLRRSVLSH